MENRPSRQLWVAAIVVSVICVAALAWGVLHYWDEPAAKPIAPVATGAPEGGGSGFGLGLMIGLGAGIVVGSLIALRARKR